jgi:fructose-bisphosphate aldolase class II
MNLNELILNTEKRGVAIGHFNFCELTVFRAATNIAEELGLPIILGTSEGEQDFLDLKMIKALIDEFSVSNNIFFNADHTKSLERIKKAVSIGYDAVLFDGSQLPFDENIRQTKEVVEYVKLQQASHPDQPAILVEGEIGYIGSSSKLHEELPQGIELTSPEEAVRFVQETGVDLLAPAVGNIHGIVTRTNADGTRTYAEPRLDIQRIINIKKALQEELGRSVPLVLHGASGNSDEDIQAAIKAGINIIHINTEIRLAWRNALAEFLKNNEKEIAPYKILAEAQKAAGEVIKRKLMLFNRI